MKITAKSLVVSALAASALASVAWAAPVNYTIQTQLETLNVATVESDTAIENITGITRKVSGTIAFDADAKTGSATIKVDGSTIKTGSDMRDGHMRSAGWLNFDATPDIVFTTTSVKFLSGSKYLVKGNLTLNGVTKAIKATADVKATAANEATKMSYIPGNALGISVKFNIKLSDFKVKNPAINAGKVNNTLTITLKAIASDK